MSTNREQKQNGYTNGENGLAPLSWGRLRRIKAAIDHEGEVSDEDGAGLAAAAYLMDFQELRKIPADKLVEAANAFAEDLPARTVMQCGEAFGRDVSAMSASEVKPSGDAGKSKLEEGAAPELTPASLEPDCAPA